MWGRSGSWYVCKTLQLCKNSRIPPLAPPSRVVRSFHSIHTGSQGRLHHPAHFKHRTNQPLLSQTHRTVRWYSESGGTKGGGAGKKPPEGGGGNFFQRFVDNIRKEMKGGEVQESLKGFNEEREEMTQSYVVQQAKLKWSATIQKLQEALFKGSEKTSQGWSVVKKTSTKASRVAENCTTGKCLVKF